jgi:hypothetical protein
VCATSSAGPAPASVEQDEKRKALNAFVRSSGLSDAVVDFGAATLDPSTGGLRPETVPDSASGGPGDRLYPDGAGCLATGPASIWALQCHRSSPGPGEAPPAHASWREAAPLEQVGILMKRTGPERMVGRRGAPDAEGAAGRG